MVDEVDEYIRHHPKQLFKIVYDKKTKNSQGTPLHVMCRNLNIKMFEICSAYIDRFDISQASNERHPLQWILDENGEDEKKNSKSNRSVDKIYKDELYFDKKKNDTPALDTLANKKRNDILTFVDELIELSRMRGLSLQPLIEECCNIKMYYSIYRI